MKHITHDCTDSDDTRYLVAFCCYLGMFVSSCRDGLICVWDTRCSSGHRPANTIHIGHIPARNGPPPRKKKRIPTGASVTDVRFHGDNKIASAGGGDG